ncbi:carbamoyl-phosphate synthase large subunit [Dendrobium catenatum]|uniref:Carbamoyl-phosphate synthase large subunit n=1 Tax=Dendrobium catenatum TaxID=906689 RepID=A0A2I0WPQ9_9ASPA|nr:carbamoyl-phosphate synthase large subunit [Dendrobium catenatum]
MPLVMSGKTIYDIGFTSEVIRKHVSIKEAVLPFEKFQGCDVLLGPEMRSTGEVMGVDFNFHVAFAKAQIAAVDGRQLRRMALACKIPLITTVSEALATVKALRSLKHSSSKMLALHDYFHPVEEELDL